MVIGMVFVRDPDVNDSYTLSLLSSTNDWISLTGMCDTNSFCVHLPNQKIGLLLDTGGLCNLSMADLNLSRRSAVNLPACTLGQCTL